ncbi:MAG: hypothetical protein IT432_09025 [Phycisphaerales bacterium]|nr:hypothetical protein [Phycisphaerales bacterium]
MRTTRNVAAVACALLALAGHAQAQKAITTGYMFWNKRAEGNDVLSAVNLNKVLNDNLGDAQQVNFFLDACYSGAMIDLATDPKYKLTIPYFLGTSDNGKTKSTDIGSSKDANPPGRLKHSKKDYYFGGYTPYLVKQLRAGSPKVKDLHASAKADVEKDPARLYNEKPQSDKGNGADDQLKINAGTNKKHALVFGGDLSRLYTRPVQEMWIALKDKGYDSLKLYEHNLINQTFEGADIEGSGTYENFKSELQAYKTAMAADKGKQTASIFLETHGVRDTKDFKYQVNAIPNTPKQGEVITGGVQSLGLLMDNDFWRDLKEDLLVDDPNQVRAVQPRLYVSYSEAAFAPNSTMNISLGGINLGDFLLPSTTIGGMLELPLTDSLLTQFITLNDGLPEVAVNFSLNDGDSFRLATDDDVLFDPNFTPLNYGTGLIVGVQGVPAPGAIVLAVAAMALTTRKRERSARR